jgi:hypothetical protein
MDRFWDDLADHVLEQSGVERQLKAMRLISRDERTFRMLRAKLQVRLELLQLALKDARFTKDGE